MSWLDRIVPTIGRTRRDDRRQSIPDGLWIKCPKCEAVLYKPDLESHDNVCPKCGHHMRMGARTRLEWFLDKEGREELQANLMPADRLKFKDSKRYKDRLSAAQKSTGENDALISMRGRLNGQDIVAVAFEFSFIGGSMGSVVGEKFAHAAEVALENRIPLVCFSASGGARMQEALFSLMQMAKTSAALEKLKLAGVPYVSVLTDPVFGGVSASLAMLGDINVAEPNALIGFAGPRVIEQTVREKLPEGFQRSEYLLEHGTIDMIIKRGEMKGTLDRILRKMTHQPSAEPSDSDNEWSDDALLEETSSSDTDVAQSGTSSTSSAKTHGGD